jgi:hypothetical protein
VKRDDMFSSKRSLFGGAASRVFNRSSMQASGKPPLAQVDGGEPPNAWDLLTTHFMVRPSSAAHGQAMQTDRPRKSEKR